MTEKTTVSNYFAFSHLPPKSQAVIKPIAELVDKLDALLPPSAAKIAGMGWLLEAKDCFARCAADMPEPDAGATPPHQQRVIDEKAARDGEIFRLDAFICSSPIFATLPADEQARLRRQLDVMRELSVVLGDRIAAF